MVKVGKSTAGSVGQVVIFTAAVFFGVALPSFLIDFSAAGRTVFKFIANGCCGCGFNTEVLAASFKNSQQVLELTKYGIGAATVGTAGIPASVQEPAKSMAAMREECGNDIKKAPFNL